MSRLPRRRGPTSSKAPAAARSERGESSRGEWGWAPNEQPRGRGLTCTGSLPVFRSSLQVVLGLRWPSAAQTRLRQYPGTLKPLGRRAAGVTATAVNANTNVTTTAVTNESGVYLVSSLVTGKYRVTFNLTGFGPVARELEIRSGDRVRVDVTLQVGAMTEEVRVTAETPLLETTTATRSTVLDQEKVENLPLSAAPVQLAMTVSGVTWETTRQSISNRVRHGAGRPRDQRRPLAIERVPVGRAEREP